MQLTLGVILKKFSEGLQSGKKGGYAEDPNYAESLANTLDITRGIYEPPKGEEEEKKSFRSRN